MPLLLKVLKNVKFPMVRLYPYVICHKVIPLCHFKWSDSCISCKLIITSIVLMDLYLMFCQNYYIILLCTYIRRYIKNWWSLFMMLSSVQFSHSFVSNSLQPHESLHARPPCPSPTPGVYSNSNIRGLGVMKWTGWFSCCITVWWWAEEASFHTSHAVVSGMLRTLDI